MIDVDIDDHNPDSDGSNTPVINVNVHVNQPHGQTNVSVLPGPSSGMPFPPVPPHHHGLTHGGGPSFNFSQSAPATTGGAIWAGGSTPVVQLPPHQHFHQHQHHQTHQDHAQHVTGMMQSTILDEVEGDEAFGEESEIMDRD
ncbi:uncharacterized protein MYCFIDRAFT_209991 [Pseudocercospora fijiensis CIRAD86]|uniref:Uncharacterized protein n=1 Tax=Pseudocercospora fijiensis (strain CIRAD86) TaxID=383855 RepID=N1Q8B1_PSEFD|nr:uncharacterized protein MYCFIDRAFT_209991 [Pseudocercospora fijiensis CIRAD86]EME89115.1 hypothetical protein MYCFIDRAFT_209991 [Pseudocercospora fijiensis CIRAD86]